MDAFWKTIGSHFSDTAGKPRSTFRAFVGMQMVEALDTATHSAESNDKTLQNDIERALSNIDTLNKSDLTDLPLTSAEIQCLRSEWIYPIWGHISSAAQNYSHFHYPNRWRLLRTRKNFLGMVAMNPKAGTPCGLSQGYQNLRSFGIRGRRTTIVLLEQHMCMASAMVKP